MLVTGCWTEVPYEEEAVGSSDNDVTKEEMTDAGGFDTPIAASTETSDTQTEQIQNNTAQKETGEKKESQSLLPWETADSSDETPNLFSKSKPVTPEAIQPKELEAAEGETRETDSNAEESSEDDFGDFLAEEYQGLLEKQNTEASQPNKPADQPNAVASNLTPPRYGYESTPQIGALKIPELKKPSNKRKVTEEKSEPIPDKQEEDFLFDPVEPEPFEEEPKALITKRSEPTPAKPSTEAPLATADSSDEPLMPWELPAKPAETIVKDRYQEDSVTIAPDEEIEEAVELPVPDKLPIATLTPKQPTPSRGKEATRLASLDPLPAVPVLRFNTRHMAWLLGGKLGLSRLAELEGATSSEVSQWTSESQRLAKQLEVPLPQQANRSDSVGQRVKALLDAAAEASDSMAIEHGSDHAALLEISLKTNALLVMCKKYPELAAPTARAVEKAAERAELPGFLWREMTKTLLKESTPDKIFDAVTQMHDNVESYLR